jgi:DNA replicative helicase MCM subunit Mcm2 (Cdc46/Mcm family)
MSSAMLSRFDLLFILLDKADDARDQRLSEHVMALHSGACPSALWPLTARLVHNRHCRDERSARWRVVPN